MELGINVFADDAEVVWVLPNWLKFTIFLASLLSALVPPLLLAANATTDDALASNILVAILVSLQVACMVCLLKSYLRWRRT